MEFNKDQSQTFGEFLLTPRLTTKKCNTDNVSLSTYLTRYSEKDPSIEPLMLNSPTVSAIMQSVSGPELAVALAQMGGLSFIYCSQTIEAQCKMIETVKKKKAGFVKSDSNLRPTDTLTKILELKTQNGHSTMPVTHNGGSFGKLLGIITSRDYDSSRTPNDQPVSEYMTPIKKLIVGKSNFTISDANNMIWEHKLNSLPIISKGGYLRSMVFRKDHEQHSENKNELLDDKKRFLVGAGVNTRDYKERIPALIKAGADVLCIDSSDGFSEWVKDVIVYVRGAYGDSVKIGAGNVVSAEAFNYLAKAGADFIKVGIGGGSICITREQKGIGCGQATAVMEVAQARDFYHEHYGMYIPICSDGGIVLDNHVTMALAMGADFVMMGRYFARFEEAPGKKITINGNIMKEYWGEGSNKAKNWQRYDMGGQNSLTFEEGVDSYVPYAGSLKDNLSELLHKVKSTMCNCGSTSLAEFRKNAILRPVSPLTISESGTHSVIEKNSSNNNRT